jgi:transcriptional antiterminator RfaH
MPNIPIWYIVQSKPMQEIRAKEQLLNQSFKVYLPLIKREKVIGSRVKKVNEPYFSRYLFVSKDSDNQNFSLIPYTKGVSKLIKFGGLPALISNEVVDSIKKSLEFSTSEALFKSGDSVKIVDGALKGLMGIYLEKTAEGRARILIDLLSKSHELHIEHLNVIPIQV